MTTRPLGLPAGSVRAISFLTIIGTMCFLALRNNEAPDWLLTFAGTAFGFYFGSRTSEESPPPPPPPQYDTAPLA